MAIAIALTLTACGAVSAPRVPGARAPARVTVGSYRRLPVDFLGFNTEALTAPGRLWSSPRFVSAVARLGPEALRLFGGTTANFWDWRSGTFTTGAGVPHALAVARPRIHIGLRDWAHLTHAAGAGPVYDLNLVTSTLPEQLAMLRRARALGLPVARVELGNELYLSRYHTQFPTGADYGRLANRWMAALKAAFPGVRVAVPYALVGGAAGFRLDARLREWNRSMLTTLHGEDAVAVHPYFDSGLSVDESPVDASAARILLSAPLRAYVLLRSQVLDELPPDVSAWITEFNLHDRRAPVHGTWGQGLDVASFVLALLGDTRIDQVDEHALVYSAPFAALFTDRRGLDFGPLDTAHAATASGFRSPGPADPSTTPYATSASGTAMEIMLRALRGRRRAAPLWLRGHTHGSEGVAGEVFAAGGRSSAVLVNVAAGPVGLALPADLSEEPYQTVCGPVGTVVTGPGSLTRRSGLVHGAIVLPPHSLTRLG